MVHRSAPALLVASIALGLVACGPSEEERRRAEADAAAAAAGAQSAEQLALYEQARSDGNYEIAASYGELILSLHADTAAADAVRRSWDEVEARAAEARDRRRVEALWVYHEVEEEGGLTRTAYIDSEAPGRIQAPVRLVLRDHHEWGESVYLLPDGDEPRFACANPCDISIRFDPGETGEFEATVSEPTENHAMFIDDGEAFLAGLRTAERVHIEAESEDGEPIELVYEVGGFDPERFAGDETARTD